MLISPPKRDDLRLCLTSLLLTERLPNFLADRFWTHVLHSSSRSDKACHSESGSCRTRNLPPTPYWKAQIAFERSFGALRQPQDDNVESAPLALSG